MDQKTQLSSLGESRVLSEFIKQGYDVFTQFSGKSPIDLVVYKDKTLFRVQVKTTSTRTKYNTGWSVQLKKVRPNSQTNKITNFSNDSCDILAVFIEPEDRVVLIPTASIKVTTALIVS